MSKVMDLTGTCNRKIRRYRMELVLWSFRNNFEGILGLISDDFKNLGLNNYELEQFINICDNRLERSKTFLNEIAVVLGFDFVALSVIASLVETGEGDPLLSILLNSDYGILFRLLVIFLIVVILPLFTSLGHYRTQIHGWTAFKEQAIMMKQQPEKDSNNQ